MIPIEVVGDWCAAGPCGSDIQRAEGSSNPRKEKIFIADANGAISIATILDAGDAIEDLHPQCAAVRVSTSSIELSDDKCRPRSGHRVLPRLADNG